MAPSEDQQQAISWIVSILGTVVVAFWNWLTSKKATKKVSQHAEVINTTQMVAIAAVQDDVKKLNVTLDSMLEAQRAQGIALRMHDGAIQEVQTAVGNMVGVVAKVAKQQEAASKVMLEVGKTYKEWLNSEMVRIRTKTKEGE